MSRRPILILAACCTGVAVALSVAGAWNRAGLPMERALFAAVAALLTIGAHVLLALGRHESPGYRLAVLALWLVCLAAVVAGHLAFFAGAERHAGELRADEARQGERTGAIVARPLAEVAADLAGAVGQAERLRVALARCTHCDDTRARLTGLDARAAALRVEEAEARRRIALEDAAAERRQAARTDPVSARLAAVAGTTPGAVSLVTGVASAMVLELLGALLWIKVAHGRVTEAASTSGVTAPVVAGTVGAEPADTGVAATTSHASSGPEVTASQAQTVPGPGLATAPQPFAGPEAGSPSPRTDSDLTRIAQAIQRGEVRPTVSAIRQHLRCSQAKAAEVRRRLAVPNGAAINM